MDPTSTNPDRQVEDAKQSFAARAEELGRRFRGVRDRFEDLRHRFDDLRHRIELGPRIEKRPLLAVGVAFAAGALLGLLRSSGRHPDIVVQHEEPAISAPAKSAIAGALGAFAMSVVRDFAMRQVSGVAIDWLDRRREAAASQQPETEAFIEH